MPLVAIGTMQEVSIHAPRVGSDNQVMFTAIAAKLFQSTLPVWGATSPLKISPAQLKVSIHAPRVGSDSILDAISRLLSVSIHAPRVGSDFIYFSPSDARLVSIHAPRVGSDLTAGLNDAGADIVSIHAPRVGSDSRQLSAPRARKSFNPRSPCGERQGKLGITFAVDVVSIHAPRVGSDGDSHDLPMWSSSFNPRSPCGERPPGDNVTIPINQFQSTLPVWGATISLYFGRLISEVSIHAPRVGSD